MHRLRHRGWTFFPGSTEAQPDGDPLVALTPEREPSAQALIAGDGEPSWWGTAFQRLFHLARPGV